MTAELKTVRDWIRWTASQLVANQCYFGHGTDNAWDEAVYLILHTLHLPLDHLAPVMDARLTAEEKQQVLAVIQKRINTRMPSPYITHEAFFADLSFYVDERVLIPRSPVAELIQQHFSPWKSSETVSYVLDLCTGSGCIAIACAAAFPDAEIIASDISTDALAVAQMNIEKYQLTDQVQLVQSDLFANLVGQQFDVIISNPPYVDAEDMSTLPAEYLHEPRLALAAGEDGLVIVKKILSQSKTYLAKDGILIVEVGNSRDALVTQFPDIPFTWLEFAHGDSDVFLLSKDHLQHL